MTSVFRKGALLVVCVLSTTVPLSILSAQDTPEPKPEFSIGVLVDTHAHQKNVIEFEREAVISTADTFRDIAAESFLITYSDKVELIQDWSSMNPGLKQAATRTYLDIESGRSGQALLYDGVKTSLLKLISRNSARSKALIIITEGNDRGSATKYAEIANLAKSSRIRCFVLLVADHPLIGGRVRHFGFYLYELASATKAEAYDVGTSQKDLAKALKDVLKRVTQ